MTRLCNLKIWGEQVCLETKTALNIRLMLDSVDCLTPARFIPTVFARRFRTGCCSSPFVSLSIGGGSLT